MTNSSRPTTLKAGSLLLDPKNTRIPADRRTDDQRRLLHELLEHEDIKSLTASIAKLGLFPNERLVVTREGRRYVVLEGNRRLAAVKLLFNPELAPTDAQVRYFRKLSSKTDLSALSKLDASIVPDRLAAAPIIAALHTREAKKKWSTLQQARFYRELLDEGQTPAEIADSLAITLGQVKSYLRAENLHSLALSLKYPSEIRRKIDDSRFPLSTLERFLESKVGRKFLGVELDDELGFRGVVHPDRFKEVLRQVSIDIVKKRGFTREINDEKGFLKYIENTRNKVPKTKVRGSFTPSDLLGGGTTRKTSTAPDSEPTRIKRQPKPSPSVIPRGFICDSKHDRVRAIFNELKRMDIKNQRNSTGVMLRVLLDIALWSFLKDVHHAETVCDHFDPTGKKRNYNSEWTPPLRDLISYAVDKRLFPGMTADGYKAVRTLASKDSSYIITIEGFNAITHNPFVIPTESDLRALWLRAEPMLEIILSQ